MSGNEIYAIGGGVLADVKIISPVYLKTLRIFPANEEV